ncbi:hypothetical protein BDV96DRAFT_644020 [Lophiotrema nucula]|uniref:BTB domain-containing protein n=1 Tax=Lophiotrema nucula TaxID=690887 RepID=A0A6A5ZDQ1_9PLEO|nr:hypothetical protein BDV96DRAFT_644020 [Lophiotrema nucula]
MVSKGKAKAPPLVSAAASQDIITVYVGANRKQYNLHKALLTHHSGYFRGALSGAWAEAQDRSVNLEHVRTGPFNVFVNWMYTGKLPGRFITEEWNDEDPDPEEVKGNRSEMMDFHRAYALADMLLVPGLKRALFDLGFRFLERCSDFPKCIVYAYANLPENDLHIRLLVDSFCFHKKLAATDMASPEIANIYPKQFLLHVIARLVGPDRDKPLSREDYVFEDDKKDGTG